MAKEKDSQRWRCQLCGHGFRAIRADSCPQCGQSEVEAVTTPYR